jgi:uncharacterized caspase-like protein
LLIGVEKYHRASHLRFTVNDVRQLASTLQTRGGLAKESILELTDDAPNPRAQPLKASLLAEVPAWLGKPGPEDQVIVYFSGHGFRDSDGKMYLAPLDCDPSNPTETGIPVEWLRARIAECPAAFKLLVLDACHAGSEKGVEASQTVPAKDLGQPFADLEKVVTLASSTADQKSQIWEDKQQSLFSFWLNQGLKGHADRDGDGGVDIHELYEYVDRTVRQTAAARFPRPQTPVFIRRAGTTGVPVVVQLQEQNLKDVLNEMAELLAVGIEERRLAKIGVLEFTNDTKIGELLGADFGQLGKWCAEELERRLVERSAGKFSVVDQRTLQAALVGFGIGDLASNQALKQLATRAGGVSVIAVGTLRNRSGRVVNMQCKLLQTDNNELAGVVSGKAWLNESERGMLGDSFQVKPEDRRPELPLNGARPRPIEDLVIERVDQRAAGPHPLLDRSFPFRVRIMVAGKERQGIARGNDYFVPLRKGEKYEIWIENKSGQIALMRLLVDGLNTLPEKEEPTKGVLVYQVAQRVNLAAARPWVLDPARGSVNAIRGFVTETGVNGKLRDFIVVDGQQSLAGRRQFTEQIGIITAAFYAPAGGSRRIGTAAGDERREDLKERAGFTPGNLLGAVQIRYAEPSELGFR